MSNWNLSISDDIRPLKTWGIEAAALNYVSQMPGQLLLTSAAALPLVFQQPVELFYGGARRFWGVVTRLAVDERPEGLRYQYTVADPWWYLDQIVYQQPRDVLVDPTDRNKGTASIAMPSALIFGSAGIRTQAHAAFDWAKKHGAPIARASNFGFDAKVPKESAADLSCAEIMRRAFRWVRDLVTWWDYTLPFPTLFAARRSSLPTVAIDLNAGQASQLSIEPRHDLQPLGVRIQFIVTEEDDDGVQSYRFVNQSAGVITGGVRNLLYTQKLTGVGEDAEEIPSGLANLLFSALSTLQWQGSVTIHAPGASSAYGPGRVLNVLGGPTAWESMAALIQQTTEDLLTGDVRIEFGPAEQLGMQDYYELLKFRSGGGGGGGEGGGGDSGGAAPAAPEPPKGGGGGGEGGGGGGGPGYYELIVCDGGQSKTIRVAGTLV